MIIDCNAGFLEKSKMPHINLTYWQCQLIAGYIRWLARESLTSNFNEKIDYNSVFFLMMSDVQMITLALLRNITFPPGGQPSFEL